MVDAPGLEQARRYPLMVQLALQTVPSHVPRYQGRWLAMSSLGRLGRRGAALRGALRAPSPYAARERQPLAVPAAAAHRGSLHALPLRGLRLAPPAGRRTLRVAARAHLPAHDNAGYAQPVLVANHLSVPRLRSSVSRLPTDRAATTRSCVPHPSEMGKQGAQAVTVTSAARSDAQRGPAKPPVPEATEPGQPHREDSHRLLLVTPEDAAAMLSLGRTTVYQLMGTGELHSVRIGRARRIPTAALEAFIGRLTDSANALTVTGHGLPDHQPGRDAAPPESRSRLSLDHSGPSRGGTRRSGLAGKQGRTVWLRATAAEVVDQTEGEANP